jgi:hypothetical protein
MILPSPEAENPAAGVRSERAAADVGLIGLGQIGQGWPIRPPVS